MDLPPQLDLGSWLITMDVRRQTLTLDGQELPWPAEHGRPLHLVPGLAVEMGTDHVVLDRSEAHSGEVYHRYQAGVLEVSDSLHRLCPAPTLSELSLPVLLGDCLGLRPAPDQTHLPGVHRTPCLSRTLLSNRGSATRAYTDSLLRFSAARPTDAEELIRNAARTAAEGWDDASVAVAVSGGVASQALLRAMSDGRARRAVTADVDTGQVTVTGQPDSFWSTPELTADVSALRCWPVAQTRARGTLLALAAARSQFSCLVTGHHLRVLLGAGPEEVHALAGPLGRLTAEPLGARRRRRRSADHAGPDAQSGQAVGRAGHDHDTEHTGGRIIIPGWFSSEARQAVHVAQLATRAAWSDWFRDIPARASRVLWAITDPTMAALADVSRSVGVHLVTPAAGARVLPQMLHLPLRQRGQLDHGRYIDAPALHRIAPDALHSAGGFRARRHAVSWAARSEGQLRAFAHDGFLARERLIDPGRVEEVLANPFLLAEQAPTLLQAVRLDAWLSEREAKA
ncbi:hypothetical protein AWW66_25100 [Micromonospora rosaria]|uniref:Asparagine synthetase domain-containing protein n=1 Tax=Micromonospora rosaria TaxID=47874 RepID=A0A136PLR8_9ACTN|nr:hypothetical protein [Micromonospora rosaria]KXK59276.1 hypothetical protein AWW66_25100 [Micromonospora rosaria]